MKREKGTPGELGLISVELTRAGYSKAVETSDKMRAVEQADDRIFTEELLSILPPREKDILKRHIQLGETLEEIGKSYNVSKEVIRQAESHALRKIRKKFGDDELWKDYEYRTTAKNFVDMEFFKNPNRFLMIEYLVKYFSEKGYQEFSELERIVVERLLFNQKYFDFEKEVFEKLQKNLGHYTTHANIGFERNNLIRGVFTKLKAVLAKKFPRIKDLKLI